MDVDGRPTRSPDALTVEGAGEPLSHWTADHRRPSSHRKRVQLSPPPPASPRKSRRLVQVLHRPPATSPPCPPCEAVRQHRPDHLARDIPPGWRGGRRRRASRAFFDLPSSREKIFEIFGKTYLGEVGVCFGGWTSARRREGSRGGGVGWRGEWEGLPLALALPVAAYVPPVGVPFARDAQPYGIGEKPEGGRCRGGKCGGKKKPRG